MLDRDKWDWQTPLGYTFLTNVFTTYHSGDPDPETVEQQIANLIEKYGVRNVRVLEYAYDRDRKLLPDAKAVFIRTEAYEKHA
jgi:hypothetical protein